jgi:hypothetical protein
MRVLNTGEVGINTNVPVRMLDVIWNTINTDFSAIRGQSTGNARVYGVHGLATTATTTNASGVRGDALALTGFTNGVLGVSPSPDGTGVFGNATNATSFNSIGVLGLANRGTGVWGEGLAADGWGVAGFANVLNGIGVYGSSNSATGFGLQGFNANITGTGIIASGNNVLATYLTGGSGGAFSGSTYGIAAFKDGALANNTAAGYFVASTTANVGVLVGARVGGTNYKIINIGAFGGTVSTDVWDTDNKTRRIMFAPESPEILFQDYGKGQLVNGRAQIKLDPIFSNNIFIDDKHPLQVYIQLEEECNGVYVTNKSATGFDVVELMQGSSNANFTYFVSANRRDYIDQVTGEIISKHEGVRFPLAPEPDLFNSVKSLQKDTKPRILERNQNLNMEGGKK